MLYLNTDECDVWVLQVGSWVESQTANEHVITVALVIIAVTFSVVAIASQDIITASASLRNTLYCI